MALRVARLACNCESRLFLSPPVQLGRFYSSDPPSKPKQNGKYSSENVRKNVKGYMFHRFFDHVKNYHQVLEKNFPSAVRVYRVFFDGVKDFFGDMKRYLKISRIANESPKGPKALNRKELELYLQMPRDMIKVAPAIILSSLPMIGYLAFPIAYMYPKTFLTSHFWTLQQKAEFQQYMLKERLKNNRAVFRQLQANLSEVKNDNNHNNLKDVLGLIGSGFHPSVDRILEVKSVFARPPYDFNSLNYTHIKLLAKMHGMPGSLFRRHRMAEHGYIIHFMDAAITCEGGVHNMPQDAIRYACFLRGLNSSNLGNEEMIEWLRRWIDVSLAITEEHLSLFLHLPILLAYNHPNNWGLVYGEKQRALQGK